MPDIFIGCCAGWQPLRVAADSLEWSVYCSFLKILYTKPQRTLHLAREGLTSLRESNSSITQICEESLEACQPLYLSLHIASCSPWKETYAIAYSYSRWGLAEIGGSNN